MHQIIFYTLSLADKTCITNAILNPYIRPWHSQGSHTFRLVSYTDVHPKRGITFAKSNRLVYLSESRYTFSIFSAINQSRWKPCSTGCGRSDLRNDWCIFHGYFSTICVVGSRIRYECSTQSFSLFKWSLASCGSLCFTVTLIVPIT